MDRLVIRFIERPDSRSRKQMLRWFCYVFGLSGIGEDSPIEEKILGRFTEAAYNNMGLSSSELDLGTKMARSTVIYHLNRFIDAGLIVRHGRKYYLRASEMHKAIEEIEYDINRELQRMLDTAREFDNLMLSSMKDGKVKVDIYGRGKGAQRRRR